ncbi:putative response regulator [Octadecabacter antarcticus 307]|uniref:Putative response regulator n=1 Tax=Octadecabacter antarcticus 307 TaxID=391626 RepID=M9R4L8_9RHOB|nr:ANTAR domain-containing protein [Octadecabacter antarcticus]AGI67559.1 putative response regulator [Octadecabacter antarcticus 307]
MKSSITQNFRGLRASVIHPDDTNRQTLCAVLGKLGLVVNAVEAVNFGDFHNCDVVFVDADEGIEALPQTEQCVSDLLGLPCIALIGNEAPSRLARVVRRGCASHILKPVRNTGVYTALLLAMNDHTKRQKVAREIEVLQQRLAGRRVITQAIVGILNRHNVDADTAYAWLRAEAMSRRLTIDIVAQERVANPGFGMAHSSGKRPDLDQPKDNHKNRRSTQ